MISEEDLEIEELVLSLHSMENRENTYQPAHPMSDYGNDEEEEYELLFTEILSRPTRHTDRAVKLTSERDHKMDISLG